MIRNIASGMVQGIPQLTNKVAQIVQPIFTELRSFVSEFTEAGEDMVRGIWQGFQNMSGWLESRVRAMMREIVAAVEDEMQIASPSKVFAGIGAYMAQGPGEGFERKCAALKNQSERQRTTPFPITTIRARAQSGRPETRFEVVQKHSTRTKLPTPSNSARRRGSLE
ncbi:MAG: hypothetical protein ACLU3U_12245 [Gallintestinimicrobium sp.]